MTRLSQTSRTKAARIQSSYVNRMTEVGSIDRISRIERIKDTKNQTNHPSENHLLAFERYYQTKQAVKREYKHLFKHEQQLRIAIEELDGKEILPQMKRIVQKWNQLLTSYNKVDAAVDTSYVSNIHRNFKKNAELFMMLGLALNQDNSLTFDSKTFSSVTNSKELIAKIICFFKEFIDEHNHFTNKMKKIAPFICYEKQPFELKGLIIEVEG